MLALVTYEYLITVQQEVTMVWQRKWTLVTLLFLANRYVIMVIVILQSLPTTAQVRLLHLFEGRLLILALEVKRSVAGSVLG